MDLLEFVILIAILATVAFIVYWFLRGSSGKISITRPVESRVDEYLDRRFQNLIEEWQLVTQPKLAGFKDRHYPELVEDESRMAEVKRYESEMQEILQKLEGRLDALEKELAKKGSAGK
jgi:hypothetical protein